MSEEKFFEEYREIVDPPAGFSGYEIVNDDRDNLLNICMLLSDNKVDLCAICFDDRYEFLDSLAESGFVTRDLEQEYGLAEIVGELNRVIDAHGYNIKLSAEDVLSRDGEMAKNARKHFKYLPLYDLNMCAEIIGELGCELFQVFLDCGGYTMAILPKEKMPEVRKYLE